MKKLLINIGITFITLLVVFISVEITLRVKGYKTYFPDTVQMRETRMEPKPLFNPDSIVGYHLDSGTYKIYYEDGNYWQCTNNKIGYRITSASSSLAEDSTKRNINILGCSFSYGTGLADSQTYAYLLQKKLEQYRINNYAVPGHGIAQNFVRLTKFIPIVSGDIFIYAYILGHDYKTNNANRKKMYPSRHFLKDFYFLSLTESLEVQKTKYDYKPWPFIQYSVFLNYLEDKSLECKDDMEAKHRASKNAILYINDLCKKKGATFVFAILTNDESANDMLAFCKEKGIRNVDMSVDNSLPKYNLMPYDNHPNFEANKIFAQKLYDYLTQSKALSAQ